MATVNRYGQLAWEHWKRWRPGMLAGIANPAEFFSTLGRQVDQQIDQLADQIAGPDRPGETMLQKTGRLREARISAESEVLRHQVYLAPEDEDPDDAAASRLGTWVTDQIDPDDPIQTQATPACRTSPS